MTHTPKTIQLTYVLLLFGTTLAASFIWGINTIFLLDAGLSNFEAFTANAFFTAGMVLFEVPTGVVADVRGRQLSFLLGAATLIITTLLYLLLWYVKADFWAWALVSVGLGLGFTFFSGAQEAWLVDALKATGYRGALENVFAKGQIASGAAALLGSVGGGLVAQIMNLGAPYVIRALIMTAVFVLAWVAMKDLGYHLDRTTRGVLRPSLGLVASSVSLSIRRQSIRWLILATPFSGVMIYVFYAYQPFLLELYGDRSAYVIAGLATAIFAGSQMVGGLIAGRVRRLFQRRTSAIILGCFATSGILAVAGLTSSFWLALVMVALLSMVFAIVMPIEMAYLNSLIPSRQRATVLSLTSLANSAGSVISQPALGKVADMTSYGYSFIVAASMQVLALPFLLRARYHAGKSDLVNSGENSSPGTAP